MTNILFISNLYIFPLILLRDIFSIKGLALILKNISKCDVIHIMMLPIKTMSVLKVMTYSITACRVGLAVIWEITSASTFKTAVIIIYIEHHMPSKIVYKRVLYFVYCNINDVQCNKVEFEDKLSLLKYFVFLMYQYFFFF